MVCERDGRGGARLIGTCMPFCIFHLRGDFQDRYSVCNGSRVFGFCTDTVWIWLGILDYGDGPFAPLWIVILWAAIGFTACHSLRFFSQRPMLGGLFAAVAAPISYFAGQRLGAAVLVETGGLIFVSIVWGVLFMGLFRLVEVVDGGSRH